MIRLASAAGLLLVFVAMVLTFVPTPAATADPTIDPSSCGGAGRPNCSFAGDGSGVVIGPNSCNASRACLNLGNGVQIGANSCNGERACLDIAQGARIGDGSCIGHSFSGTCYGLTGAVGNSSCLGVDTCLSVTGPVGDGSCINGLHACTGLTGPVGSHSCTGLSACQGATGPIGNIACNGSNACEGITGPVFDNLCNGFYACPGPSPTYASLRVLMYNDVDRDGTANEVTDTGEGLLTGWIFVLRDPWYDQDQFEITAFVEPTATGTYAAFDHVIPGRPYVLCEVGQADPGPTEWVNTEPTLAHGAACYYLSVDDLVAGQVTLRYFGSYEVSPPQDDGAEKHGRGNTVTPGPLVPGGQYPQDLRQPVHPQLVLPDVRSLTMESLHPWVHLSR